MRRRGLNKAPQADWLVGFIADLGLYFEALNRKWDNFVFLLNKAPSQMTGGIEQVPETGAPLVQFIVRAATFTPLQAMHKDA